MRISDWSSDVCSSDLIDDLGLGELLEAFDALLAADTGLLGPAERDIERHVEMFVHPHRARLDLQCDMETALGIIGPDRTAQPIFTVIGARSEEHTSELQSLMRISYAVFCLKKKNTLINTTTQLITPQSTPTLN